MKKILFTAVIFISILASGQNDSPLRTDGIYIFDNGLDTIVSSPKVVMDFAEQLLSEGKVKDWKNGPCGLNTIPTDSSTYLSSLAFFSDSTGRIAQIGACRDEQHIRNIALRLITKQAISDTSSLARRELLEGIQLNPDSSLLFLYFQSGCPFENYWGKASGDSIYLEMNKSTNPGFEFFNSKRKYIFYTYAEIFSCDFVYHKPPPLIKD